MNVPMEVDHVTGSESEEEDWEDVDFRRSTCYNCGMMRDFCRRIGKSKGKGGDGSKGYARGKWITVEGTGKVGGSQGVRSGEQKGWRFQGHAARSDTSRQNVHGDSPASMTKMQTAQKAKDNLNHKKMEKSRRCGSSGR